MPKKCPKILEVISKVLEKMKSSEFFCILTLQLIEMLLFLYFFFYILVCNLCFPKDKRLKNDPEVLSFFKETCLKQAQSQILTLRSFSTKLQFVCAMTAGLMSVILGCRTVLLRMGCCWWCSVKEGATSEVGVVSADCRDRSRHCPLLRRLLLKTTAKII